MVAGKRNRAATAAQQDLPVETGGADVARDDGPEDRAGGRMADMAKIARKRAAHFANFQEDDAEVDDSNVHVGSNDARTLGPWSSAVELVNARDKAQAKRADKIIENIRKHSEGQQIAWTPKRDVSLGPRPTCCVPALFQLCLETLTEYIDCVDSLWGVPDAIRVRLAGCVCSKRKMSSEVANLFAGYVPGELVLPDCTQLDSAAMKALLKEGATNRLERMELGSCGRGLGDDVAAELSRQGPLTALNSLSLRGAYRLSDAGLQSLLGVCSAVSRLELSQASRLTGAAVEVLPRLVPQLRHLDLRDCRGVGGESLVAGLSALTHLARLHLDGIPEVDDGVVAALAAALPGLTHLGLSYCQAVTDSGVSALVSHRGQQLQGLDLDECSKITDQALSALASCHDLRHLSLRRCSRLSDSALSEVCQRGTLTWLCVSGVTGVGALTMKALALCCKESLQHLDVSFCRSVSESGLGLVADACHNLTSLHLFGCSQVSNQFVHGHSNDALQLVGLGTGADFPAPSNTIASGNAANGKPMDSATFTATNTGAPK